MRTFVLVQNNFYKNPLLCWYEKYTAPAPLDEAAGVYTRWYWNTFWQDPHTEDAVRKGEVTACTRHPMNILPKRNGAMMKALLKYGAVYVNKVGGWCFPTENTEELETVEAADWPSKVEQDAQGFQYVKISKWPLGNHYYLISWPKPIQFNCEKYNTLEEAIEEAKRHVPEERIKYVESMHEKFVYNKEGD